MIKLAVSNAARDTKLVKYDAMCHAIDAAYEFDEVKVIRDQAAMLEAAAKVAGNTQAEDRCYEIRRRAERKAAMLDAAREKVQGARGTGSNQYKQVGSDARTPAQTLKELGVDKQRMSEWRRLAEVPKAQFDAAFAKGGRPSISEIIGKKKPARSAEASAALWIWGRVLDFERNGILATPPKECFREMDDFQVSDLKRLAPKIVKWLNSLLALAEKG